MKIGRFKVSRRAVSPVTALLLSQYPIFVSEARLGVSVSGGEFQK